MAIEATHLNLSSPPFLQERDLLYYYQGNVMGYNKSTPIESGPVINAVAEDALPLNQSLVYNSLWPKGSLNTDSGLTYNIPATRKRSRDSLDNLSCIPAEFATANKNSYGVTEFSSFAREQILPEIQQYESSIDTIISHHMKKIRSEIEERQKHQARLLVSAIGEGMMEKLKEKEEQIQRMGKLNFALQERLRTLYMENQVWRDMARANEATANSLRNNLEQVLAHVSEGGGGATGVEDGAVSCCGSSDSGGKDEVEEKWEGGVRTLEKEAQDRRRMCRRCGERESCVLLLPCKHLCLCTNCGSTLFQTCPICTNSTNATLHINMSS